MNKINGLSGRYVDKQGALTVIRSIGVDWTAKQVEKTAEADHSGQRLWPWFKDPKGKLRIDEGFIRFEFQQRQANVFKKWLEHQSEPGL